MSKEEVEHIISIIGEEKAEELYRYLHSKRISFACIHKYLAYKKLLPLINSSKPVQIIARQLRVARSTIYILRKKFRAKNG